MSCLCFAQDPLRFVFMKPDFLIGRDPGCELVLERPGISKRHALVRWDGKNWRVRDLGSRNGTFLRPAGSNTAERVSTENSLPLSRGDHLLFAEQDEAWVISGVEPPCSLLVQEGAGPSGAIILDPKGLLALPTELEPLATFYRDARTERWVVEEEAGSGSRTLADGDSIFVAGKVYRMHIVESADTQEISSSPLGPSLADGTLLLWPSADEESAALAYQLARGASHAPQRAHLYLLLHLARRRIADSLHHGKSEDESGWLSTHELQNQLGYSTPEHLAVDVFRCRQELKALGVADSTAIVDRGRRGHLRIGLGADKLKVEAADVERGMDASP